MKYSLPAKYQVRKDFALMKNTLDEALRGVGMCNDPPESILPIIFDSLTEYINFIKQRCLDDGIDCSQAIEKIGLDKSEIDPTISKNTLKMMDSSMENLKKGKVGPPADLDEAEPEEEPTICPTCGAENVSPPICECCGAEL